MRLRLSFNKPTPIHLPIHHNHIVQGFIYSQLEPNLANWLHDEAYTFAKRTFKMFTFSRLSGKFTLEPKKGTISFTSSLSFQLASSNHQILSSLAEHLLKSHTVRLGNNELEVLGVEILKPPEYQPVIKLKTLSPITIYSTFNKPDGSKLTHYYAPYEKDWNRLILANLAKKARALNWEENPEEALKDSYINPLKTNPKDKKVIRYKGFILEAYQGLFEASLPEAYFELAYDVGFGGKNAQGFGMVEII